MNLPLQPGLQRRLAYSEHIRQQNRIRQHNNNRTPSRLVRRNAFSIIGRNIFQPNDYDTIKIGLLVNDLFNNSEILLIENFYCSICQDVDQKHNKNIIRKLNCNHQFHILCIEKWLCSQSTCPICRKDLSFD